MSGRSEHLVARYLTELMRTLSDFQVDGINQVVECIMTSHRIGKRIYTIGNGGSATTASHIANDLNKLTISSVSRIKALALTDNVALLTAWANDYTFDVIFVEQLRNLLEPGDLLIGISTSGNSQNIVNAFAFAQLLGATTILLGGPDAGKCGDFADIQLLVEAKTQGIVEDCHLIINHIIAICVKAQLGMISSD